MTIDRWRDILEQIKTNFEVEDSGSYEDEDLGGTTTEFIEFSGPLGLMRLEFATHPLIIDTKTHYHKRIGSETTVNHIFSPTEKTHTLSIFKYDEAIEDWIPFKTNLFN